jgi:LmbE family N-acetylglucosaminyl deacetylase
VSEARETPARFDCAALDPLALAGPVLVLAPHSDDEALGCGGTLALLATAGVAAHVVYMTDGRRSPTGADGNPAPDADALVETRRQEARDAMAVLGVPADRLHFLDFPDGSLSAAEDRAGARLAALVERLQPRTMFAPFRHDQHPDHLATHRLARRLARDGIALYQYFVYYRYPMTPGTDIRRAVASRHLRRVDIAEVREVKRRALACYPSQTTAYYPWQTRAVLTPGTLERLTSGDEVFAAFAADTRDRALFEGVPPWFWPALRFGPRAVFLKKRYLG